MDSNSSFAVLYDAWERFTTDNEIDAETVREEIARSWQRCRRAGLSPRAPKVPVRLDANQLAELLHKNRAYIEAAAPLLQFPESAVRGTGFILVLTEASGIVLEVFGDTDVIERARANNYVPGCCRSEEEVGTNSIGLAMVERRPIQLSGPEHYNARHHCWTCASAPVFAPSGAFLGTVTLSGQSMYAHQHTLGLVMAAADAIQNRLREQQMEIERCRSERLARSLLRWSNDAIVVLNAEGEIAQVNKMAEAVLGSEEAKLVGRKVVTALQAPAMTEIFAGQGNAPAFESTVAGAGYRGSVLVRPFVLRNEEGVQGAILTIGRRESAKGGRGPLEHAARFAFADNIGRHDSIRRQIEFAKLLAPQDTRILITGETGTGKELMAHGIHSASARSQHPFVVINCAAIPRELLEAELFGYKEGAFTGARRGGQTGKVQLADGGTLFLDEISLMPLELQGKILRVLEDGIITRLGDTTPIRVNVRVMAATNDDLFELSGKGAFRRDLYFRLAVAEIKLPPLRERIDDLAVLCEAILARICRRSGRPDATVSPPALACLASYSWPGNIRELENVLEISALLSQDGVIRKEGLPDRLRAETSDSASAREERSSSGAPRRELCLSDIEADVIRDALRRHNFNISRASRALGDPYLDPQWNRCARSATDHPRMQRKQWIVCPAPGQLHLGEPGCDFVGQEGGELGVGGLAARREHLLQHLADGFH
jgi:transcriptional regulator of acetoin/glycerol metabolism